MGDTWASARSLQLALAIDGDHRRIPVVDLVIAAACQHHGVSVLHYDADFERIAAMGDLRHRWLVPPGTLA